ncbi:MAG: hypothetical protein Q8L66_13295 [Caulobacter sp.]|nr:hypothetical protein [Caulobacter sp.]
MHVADNVSQNAATYMPMIPRGFREVGPTTIIASRGASKNARSSFDRKSYAKSGVAKKRRGVEGKRRGAEWKIEK